LHQLSWLAIIPSYRQQWRTKETNANQKAEAEKNDHRRDSPAVAEGPRIPQARGGVLRNHPARITEGSGSPKEEVMSYFPEPPKRESAGSLLVGLAAIALIVVVCIASDPSEFMYRVRLALSWVTR
jgi:hypothetical protein